MFATNPWPTLPELVPSSNSDILLKYLASYHAVATGQQQTQSNAAAKDMIYPWMRDASSLNASMKRSPFQLQSGGLTLMSSNNPYGAGINQLMSSSESLASPISPQPTPPTSLSPGKHRFDLSNLLDFPIF
jgi:hypothetical protein